MPNSKDYKIVNVEPTNFEPDQYGNRFWSIDVDGHDGKLLWKTKAEPERGQVVYGHTEMSQSGKSMLFKRDKKEDGGLPGSWGKSSPASSPAATGHSSDNKQHEIMWSICVKEAANFITKNNEDMPAGNWSEYIAEYAACLYKRVKEVPVSSAPLSQQQALNTAKDSEFSDDEFPLDKIPF